MEYEKMEGIRRSDLWYMNKTPAHFKYHMDNPKSLQHLCCLELRHIWPC